MSSSITTSQEMENLALNVSEEGGSAYPEEVSGEPLVAQLFFDEDEPLDCVFGCPNASSRFETNL